MRLNDQYEIHCLVFSFNAWSRSIEVQELFCWVKSYKPTGPLLPELIPVSVA